MGNLYTQLVKRQSPRINILSELKREWEANPRNMKRIKELQNKLKDSPWVQYNLSGYNPKTKNKPKKITTYIDSFGNAYRG